MTEVLRMYVDPAWRRDAGHIPLLYPQWGITFSEKLPFTRQVFESYPFDTSQYEIVDDLERAHIVMLPYRYDVAALHFPDLIEEVLQVAREAGKKVLIDAMGDIDQPVPYPDVIVLKYGGYRFEKKANEITLPPFADDLLERYCKGSLSVRAKTEVPIVGFAGWLAAPLARRWYWRLRNLRAEVQGLFDDRSRALRKGIFVRRAAVRALRHSALVATNIVSRVTYSGNIKTATGDMETLRREFVENALASDLCLDVRGDANNSTRLFEILSLGRVPLIIDTERNFPFSDELDYHSFSIVVDFRDLPAVPEIARRAYDAITPQAWREMQVSARAAYAEWFRPDAMTKHLVAAIRSQI